MRKPLHLLNPEEKAEVVAHLKAQAEKAGDMPMILGNLSDIFFARPSCRKTPSAK